MPEGQQQQQGQQGTQQQGAQGQGQQQGQQGQQQTQQPASFDDWMNSQTDEVKKLYEEHTKALRGALQNERSERAQLAKQLKEAGKTLEEGSAAKKALEEFQGKLDAAEARATFFEEAAKPEIGCSNARLAFVAAQEIGAIDAKGRINWGALKEQFPELFRPKVPAGNAGAGTGTPPSGKVSMNDWIRAAAGRK